MSSRGFSRTFVIAAAVLVALLGLVIFALTREEAETDPDASLIRGATALEKRCPDALSSGIGNESFGPSSWQLEKPERKPVRLEPGEPVRFTKEAWDRCVSGVVVMELLIGTDGRVHDGRLLKSLPYGLSEAAVAAVVDRVYVPAVRDGEPVASTDTASVIFNPNSPSQSPGH